MSRPGSTRLQASILLTAAVLAGCSSQLNTTATAARPQQETAVRALLAPGAAGTTITIDDPTALPAAVQAAPTLRAVVGGRAVTVTRNPGGSLIFVIPAGTNTTLEVNGSLRVLFIMNDKDSQIVTLSTGSPIQFDTPPVQLEPNNGFIARGLKVKLTANTQAPTDKYQFTWGYSASGVGPWQPIPGSGKQVEWEPPAAGNYFLKVDAVDKTSQQAYSTTTSSAVVFVTDAKDVLTTEPASGTVQRGNPLMLKFNRPAGLNGTNLSYSWSAGPSAQGPWSVISGNGDPVSWLPTTVGSYYVRAEVSNKDTGAVNTFVSPNAVVFVSEGKPIITPSTTSVLRGDQVTLSLNIPNPGKGPFTWYYSVSGGLGTTWLPINTGTNQAGISTGALASISHIVNEAGSYNFRVDFPDAGGTIKSFTTTEPVLNVREGALPLITSDPPNATINSGGTVDLLLNARGVDETNYKFTWYASTNPSFGYTSLPITNASKSYAKKYTWRTQQVVSIGTSQLNQVQAPGSYFIRVDAAQIAGTAVYTFTSASPVVTIQP
ncbi:MAG: hypothetical protein JWM80_4886 [Cyanobacteria bacterium RYN_339]|nr:hypothetical protein [Cyanobacteria bacterium RYN_339]